MNQLFMQHLWKMSLTERAMLTQVSLPLYSSKFSFRLLFNVPLIISSLNMWRQLRCIYPSDNRLNHIDYVAIVSQPQPMTCPESLPSRQEVKGPAHRGNKEDSAGGGGVQMVKMRHCLSTTATAAKTSLEIAFFQTLSAFFHFAENIKCRWISLELISWESHPSLERERKNRPRLFMSSIKLETREIRLFHVIIMQWWLRNVQKSVLHVQSCCFALIKLIVFFRSRCRRVCRC